MSGQVCEIGDGSEDVDTLAALALWTLWSIATGRTWRACWSNVSCVTLSP